MSHQSWLQSGPGAAFTLDCLPYGVGIPLKEDGQDDFVEECRPRIYTRVGDQVIDLGMLIEHVDLEPRTNTQHAALVEAFQKTSLNDFMALGEPVWTLARRYITEALRVEPVHRALYDDRDGLRRRAIRHIHCVKMILPACIGDYTDFYSSKQHAQNVGVMFRNSDKLADNWLNLPVGYHGRASSIVVSGTEIHRPNGLVDAPNTITGAQLIPCQKLDFELELAFFVGGPNNDLGKPLSVDEAQHRIFGFVLMNDWSARDIQRYEYVPLGPFTAKNFGTTISPWIIPAEALIPFAKKIDPQRPTPSRHLQGPSLFNYDINLEVCLQTADMRARNESPSVISRTNATCLYWTAAQQLAHHTVTGCNIRAGDLMGSGTISGSGPATYGSMLELSWNGTKPLKLPDGSERSFLHDGDSITLSGFVEKNTYRVDFGVCEGTVLPAPII